MKKKVWLGWLIPCYVLALSPNEEPSSYHLQKAKEREEAIENQQLPSPRVRLGEEQHFEEAVLPRDETPCFVVEPAKITLQQEESLSFHEELQHALKILHYPSEGMCLGVAGINQIATTLQNRLIGQGYVTTRVMVEPQDLSQGHLQYTLVAGKVDRIRFGDANNTTAALVFAMPMEKGSLLNLRDIEQGLEDLRRVPSSSASMQIVPSEQMGYSDIVVDYAQALPFRGTLSVDDAGTKATGKLQGGATFSWDNPLGLNDLFYYSYTQDIGDHKKTTLNDETKQGTSHNHAWHYSVPFGYWLVSYNESDYSYNQKVAGSSQIYAYTGESTSRSINLQRVLYRDDTSKLSANVKGWERSSNNFIDDAEIDVQRRRVAGYEVGLDVRHYFESAVVDVSASYKRGTGAQDALRAPEEAFGEGTSRMRIYTLNASLQLPFELAGEKLAYFSSVIFQYNQTPLSPQDRLSIGGRSSVRGFDGEYTLSGDRGWISRNELEWNYSSTHKSYIALDAGHVSGRSAHDLLGQSLVGSAVGMRGQVALMGTLSYDVFVGVPLYKPDFFPGKDIVGGFSIVYHF